MSGEPMLQIASRAQNKKKQAAHGGLKFVNGN
jgi:hypothetical protein